MLEYWLDNAEGFEIQVRGVGRACVERVVVDPSSGRAEGLVVRSAILGRRRLVPVGAFAAVDPFERVLELDRRRGHLARVARMMWWLARAPASAIVSLIRLVVVACVLLLESLAWFGPRAWTAAIILSRLLRALARRAFAAAARLGLCVWIATIVLLLGLRSVTANAWTGGTILARLLARGAATSASWLRPRLSALVVCCARGVLAAARAAVGYARPRALELVKAIETRCGALAIRVPRLVIVGARVRRMWPWPR